MKKFASALVLTGIIVSLGAGVAQAAPSASIPFYVPGGSVGAVSDGTVAPGETVIFSGTGFLPGETIEISVGFQAQGSSETVIVLTDTVVAAADGTFEFPVTLDEEGVFTLTATGVESGNTATAQVVVDAPTTVVPAAGNIVPAAGADNGLTDNVLANTGIDSAMLLWGAAGLGALGLGAASVVVARRRADA